MNTTEQQGPPLIAARTKLVSGTCKNHAKNGSRHNQTTREEVKERGGTEKARTHLAIREPKRRLQNPWRSTHPLLRRFVRLVLPDHEHVTLHTPRSFPHWRSTHPFLRRFIRLVLHDHEHVTLHTPRSCPHWRSTHSCSPT
jgi:hypothetical protein